MSIIEVFYIDWLFRFAVFSFLLRAGGGRGGNVGEDLKKLFLFALTLNVYFNDGVLSLRLFKDLQQKTPYVYV